MHTLFVRFMQCYFWLQLLQRFRRCSAPRTISPQPATSVEHTFGTEGTVWLPTESSMRHEEQLASTDADESTHTNEREAVAAKKQSNKKEALNSWEAVAHGLNVIVSTIYLLANAIVFAIYMCPLLFLIFRHNSVTSYINDCSTWKIKFLQEWGVREQLLQNLDCPASFTKCTTIGRLVFVLVFDGHYECERAIFHISTRLHTCIAIASHSRMARFHLWLKYSYISLVYSIRNVQYISSA